MKKVWLMWLIMAMVILYFTVGIVKAECVTVSDPGEWSILDDHTFVLYENGRAKVVVEIWGFVRPWSKVVVLKTTFCMLDTKVFLIDGVPVDIRAVKKVKQD